MKNDKKKVYLDQKDNYNKNFGIVYRSSAIFYYKQNKNFNTVISFMNYWPIKRSIDIMMVASIRDMKGKLIHRERLSFDTGNVINYQPTIGDGNFEGSVELEAFAADNLMIPYIAIMVIYEAEESVSMVHAYTRTYSTHEIEEGKTITYGEEAGWVCRDTNDIHSYLILHNGISTQSKQKIKLWVTNYENITKEVVVEIPQLSSFETIKIYPQKYIKNFVEFLNGKVGSCAVSFELSGGFTRGMVCNETIDGKEMQVYHSNFNYGRHDPGLVEHKEAFFSFPYVENFDMQTVHMDAHAYNGRYKISNDKGDEFIYEPGKRLDIEMKSEVISNNPLDGGPLPARTNIVFSGYLKNSKCRLPMESARGFYHKGRPEKYNYWMVVALGKKYRSQLILQTISDLYGSIGDSTFTISLYQDDTHKVITKTFNSEDTIKFEKGIYIDELFPEVCNKKENAIGYLYMVPSTYGGHAGFSTIEAKNGSASIEHNF